MAEEPGSPQIQEHQDDSCSEELYRPEGYPQRNSTSITTPQMNFAHQEKVEPKAFSKIELVQQNAQPPHFSAESLPDLPRRKFDCARFCWKFLSVILLLSCVTEGVFLILSMQKEKDLRHELDMKVTKYNQLEIHLQRQLDMKDTKHNLLENDLRICKEQLEEDVRFSELWEAMKKQDERAHEHSLQIKTFREEKDDRDDMQDERAHEHSLQIRSFREFAEFQTARSQKRPSLPKEKILMEAEEKLGENFKQVKKDNEEETAIASSERDGDYGGVKVMNVNGINIPNLNLSAAHDFRTREMSRSGSSSHDNQNLKPSHWERKDHEDTTGHHWERKASRDS